MTCLGASVITVGSQFYHISTRYGQGYLLEDFTHHENRLRGTDPAPYRYRILTDYSLEAVLRLVAGDDPGHQAAVYKQIAFMFRLLQNFIILLLAFWYFETLGIPFPNALLGILVLSYGMCFAFYGSDLSFYTYTNMALFLLAGVLINLGRDWMIPLLTVFAALDREESILIPVMLFSARAGHVGWRSWIRFQGFSTRLVSQSVLSLLGFVMVYLTIRYLRGSAPYAASRYGAVYPGLSLLQSNVSNPLTWVGLAQMYSLLPLSLVFWSYWPVILRSYLVFVAVPWFAAQFTFASADETRLFLVPLAIVFVPAAVKLVSVVR